MNAHPTSLSSVKPENSVEHGSEIAFAYAVNWHVDKTRPTTDEKNIRHTAKTKTIRCNSFSEFRTFVETHRQTEKYLGYICAPFSDGHRCETSVMPSRLLMLDFDEIASTILYKVDAWLDEFRGLAWPTHSHTPDKPRRRGVLLVDRLINREEMARIGAALIAEATSRFGKSVTLDKSVFRAEQPNYLAPVGVDLIDLNGGELCADEWLARPAANAHDYNGGGKSKAAKGEAAASQDPVAQRLADESLIKSFEATKGKYNIVCPFSDEHTSESGDTSTVYYLPNYDGYEFGNFNCKHAHCAEKKTDDFLRKLGLDPSSVRAQQRSPFPPISQEEQAEQRERYQRIGRENAQGIPVQRLMSTPAMIAELVFIADGSRVSHVTNPFHTLAYSDFRNMTGGSFDMIESKRGSSRKVYRLDVWRDHADRMTVTTQTFAPGRPIVCESPEGKTAQNLWIEKKRAAPDNWRELVAAFLNHVAYLVPIKSERERFLDWLSHIEQKPGELPSTHYLLVTEQTGIGRNWLSYALARVHSGYTALGFDLAASLHSGFNGELGGKLLAVVDELHAGGPNATRAPNAEKLKSMLTEHTRMINPKYGRVRVEYNCCRFLMFSNHAAALPLSDNDRRVVVIANPTERRSPAYYRELYQMLDTPGFGDALAHWLRERDISRFNPGEIAPMNDAKKCTIRAGRSEIEQAIRDIADDWPSDCITSGRLSQEVKTVLGDRVNSIQGSCVAAGLMKFGKVRIDTFPQHVWILRNTPKWRVALSADIAREVLRGEQSEGLTATTSPPRSRAAGEVFKSGIFS